MLLDAALDGPANMARDEHLLHSNTLRPAAVRLYAWSPPTISLGYFQRHESLAELPAELRELATVRRLTGGGAILHDQEVTYCLTLDDRLPLARRGPADLYRVVHECWKLAVSAEFPQVRLAPEQFPFPSPRTGPFFCFERPGRTDLVLGGQKVLGSAQRRIAGRVMQHGSLMTGRRFAGHPGGHLGAPSAEAIRAWSDAFLTHLAAALGLSLQRREWSADWLADVSDRRAKYASPEWTKRR